MLEGEKKERRKRGRGVMGGVTVEMEENGESIETCQVESVEGNT